MDQNIYVNAEIINAITEECRQNILIKRKILTHLPISKISSMFMVESSYRDFDCSKLTLCDQRLDFVGFITKFIKQNY